MLWFDVERIQPAIDMPPPNTHVESVISPFDTSNISPILAFAPRNCSGPGHLKAQR